MKKKVWTLDALHTRKNLLIRMRQVLLMGASGSGKTSMRSLIL